MVLWCLMVPDILVGGSMLHSNNQSPKRWFDRNQPKLEKVAHDPVSPPAMAWPLMPEATRPPDSQRPNHQAKASPLPFMNA